MSITRSLETLLDDIFSINTLISKHSFELDNFFSAYGVNGDDDLGTALQSAAKGVGKPLAASGIALAVSLGSIIAAAITTALTPIVLIYAIFSFNFDSIPKLFVYGLLTPIIAVAAAAISVCSLLFATMSLILHTTKLAVRGIISIRESAVSFFQGLCQNNSNEGDTANKNVEQQGCIIS